MRTTHRLLPALLAVTLGLAACGGGGGGGDDDQVASLGEGAAVDDTDGDDPGDGGGGGGQGGSTGGDAEFEDAMLEFAECMRDEGIDFPDPQFGDGDGLVIMGGGPGDGEGPPSEDERREMDAANAACEHIIEDVRGSMEQPSPEEQAEMRDNMLAFAECMREHGVDFPDPQFDEDGGVSIALGGPDGGGPDPSDADFQEAQDACGEEGGFRIGTAGAASPAGGDDG